MSLAETRNQSAPVEEYPQLRTVLELYFDLDKNPDPSNFYNLRNRSICTRVGLLELYAMYVTGVQPIRIADPFPNYDVDWVFWDDDVALKMATEGKRMLRGVVSLASSAKDADEENAEGIALTAIATGNPALVKDLLSKAEENLQLVKFWEDKSLKLQMNKRPIQAMAHFIYLAINCSKEHLFTEEERKDASLSLELGISNLAQEFVARKLVFSPKGKNSRGTFHDFKGEMRESVDRGVVWKFS